MAAEQSFDGLLRWRCIGPFRGGRVVAVAGSYHEPNTFYFGACAGGVWKTIDAGHYWRNVSDGFFTTSAVGAIAVAPSDSNVIYAGMGETTIRIDVSHGDGVYKSDRRRAAPGRTSGCATPATSARSGSIRTIPTSSRSRPSAMPSVRTKNAASSNRPTAARPGAMCSSSTTRPARSTSPLIRPIRASCTPRSGKRSATSGTSSSGGPDSGLWQSHRRRRNLDRHHAAARVAHGHARQDRRRRFAGAIPAGSGR